MTGNDLIASAMRLCGVLANGENPEASEAQDAFLILNQMIDAWTADRLMIFTVNRSGPYSLTPGQQTYTMGPVVVPGIPQLVAVRPPSITAMGVIVLTNPLQPLEIPLEMLTDQQWAAIPVKNIQSSIPLKVWDDGGFPNRVLSFWCVPNTLVQVVPYVWQALQQFADLFTDYTFPPAYLKALRYNLAVDLAPEFGVENLNPITAAQAITTKAEIKKVNSPIIELSCDPAVLGSGGIYDWRSDTFINTTTGSRS